MPSRCVVNVAFSNTHYLRKQKRLAGELIKLKETRMFWWERLPEGSPTHDEMPYAFKAVALAEAAKVHSLLMWADASIIPLQRLDPIWEYAQEHGVWLSHGGWSNYEWTADSAYPDLFPEAERARTAVIDLARDRGEDYSPDQTALAGELEILRQCNRSIPHVAATAFAIDLTSITGKAFFDEYCRLATQTSAFKGPWINSPKQSPLDREHDICGPPDVKGHRHDQTCASVLAWRLGIPLTRPPEFLAYGKFGENNDERTIVLADGSI